jgi:signal transduction histidine kinase
MQQFYHSVVPQAEKDRIDANAVIREVIELTKVHLNNPPVEVVTRLCPDAGITARRTDIHEVLLNLVLNAADAMPEGGRLEIVTENTGCALAITVKDSGTGMSEEVREKCLQPFFTTKGAKGTGIGLAMVNNIVKEHGGTITIESAPGAGTSIVMTFPNSNG